MFTCANTNAHDACFEHINCPFRKINAFSERLYEIRLFPNICPNLLKVKRTTAAKSTHNSLEINCFLRGRMFSQVFAMSLPTSQLNQDYG